MPLSALTPAPVRTKSLSVVEKASTDEVYAACALKLRSAIASLLHDGFFLTVVLRLRLALIRAPRVLPSTPPLFHSRERHSWMF